MQLNLPKPPRLENQPLYNWLLKVQRYLTAAVGAITWPQITLPTKSANTVLAGPTSGAAAQVDFRALVNADIPSALDSKTIGGTTPGAGTFTTLASTGSTTLGDASADSLTINAATWTLPASSVTATTTAGTVAAGTVNQFRSDTTFTGDSGGTTALRAYYLTSTASGANAISNNVTLLADCTHNGTATITNSRVYNAATTISNTGNITTPLGFNHQFVLSSSGGSTTGRSFSASAPSLTSTGAFTTLSGFHASNQGHATLVTNAIGFNCDDFTASLTLTAAFRSLMTSGTGKWGFYASGTANNAFNGSVRIGSVTAPTVALDVTGAILASTTITSAGPTSGIGYSTGAGGTVTQATSKATGVTLNKVCGQITMDAANLNDATTVSFTVTNSAVATTDTVTVVHDSAGTLGGYIVQANTVGAGAFNISVRNVSGGALAEAIVLNFNVTKSVTS